MLVVNVYIIKLLKKNSPIHVYTYIGIHMSYFILIGDARTSIKWKTKQLGRPGNVVDTHMNEIGE